MPRVCAAMRAGALALLPTDTVYGLCACACDEHAIARIIALKGRPDGKPLPLFVHSMDEAKQLVRWPPQAEKLARAFWPGALTLVLKTRPGAPLAPAYAKTAGIRVPNHDFLLRWLKLCRLPLAQTSANVSGQPAARSAKDAIALFYGKVDFIFAGGDAPGTESTVADLTGPSPRILREGAIREPELRGKL